MAYVASGAIGRHATPSLGEDDACTRGPETPDTQWPEGVWASPPLSPMRRSAGRDMHHGAATVALGRCGETPGGHSRDTGVPAAWRECTKPRVRVTVDGTVQEHEVESGLLLVHFLRDLAGKV